jgi:UDP-N-acetylmuramoylalanine--D-glutamate ligase
VVLELSSFALEGLGEAGLSPKIACITTIAPDHLDRHGTMEAYILAKEQIWRHQRPGDAVALNADSPIIRAMAVVEQRPDDVVWFASAAHPALAHAGAGSLLAGRRVGLA